MTEDTDENLQSASEIDVGMSPVTNSAQSSVGESCTKACKVHWTLRLLSVAIVGGGLGLYGLLEFAPEITNVIPDSMLNMVGLDSQHHCSSMDSMKAAPPVVDKELPFEEFTGITACALCEHGVSPLHDARTEGMAIVLKDGRIAVVENAHNFYPEAYRVREKHLPAELTGRIVKSENNVIWVHPESLELDSAELKVSDSSPK